MKKTIVSVVSVLQTLSILASDPLDTWHVRTAPTSAALNAVTFAKGRFVAVADRDAGAIFSSPDGVTWTGHPSGVDKDLSGIAFGNDTFVAIGYSGRAATSPDGMNWTPQSTGTTAHFYSVRFVNGQFVAVGDGGSVYSSPNGVTWNPHSTPSTNNWRDLTFFNGRYVLVGYTTRNALGRYGASPDLATWEIDYTGYDRYLDVVLPVAGNLLALGYAGGGQASPDGTNWGETIKAADRWIFNAVLAGDTVVAVGESGALSTWTPGGTWVKRKSGTKESLNGVAYGLNTVVVVGEEGTILQSDPLSGAQESALELINPVRDGNQFIFSFNGEVGQTYQIQATTDLVNWQSVQSVACNASPMECAVADGNNGPRFYRVLKP